MFLKLSKLHLKIGIIYLLGRTMFENSPKYLIFNFDVFHQFLPFLNWPVWYYCLPARFRLSKTLKNELLSTHNVNVARLASHAILYETFSVIFKHRAYKRVFCGNQEKYSDIEIY